MDEEEEKKSDWITPMPALRLLVKEVDGSTSFTQEKPYYFEDEGE